MISEPNVNPAPLGEIPQPFLSSGSDHKRSHIGPSWGVSYLDYISFISFKLSMDGDKPPWRQKNLLSITAVNGKKSKIFVKCFQTFVLPYFLEHSS